MEKVERIQYLAALAVTGAWQGSNRVKLYEELEWESLSERRKRVLQIHKIVDCRTPSYLRDKIPPNRRNLANLPCVFQKIKCRTNRYLNSFFPNAISIWNNIIPNFEYLPSFERLKNHLISLIRPKLRSTFDLHDSIYLRHLFQLRVGLSHLRYHKNRHNFANTSSDICLYMRGVEDTSHFLLFCLLFITHRETLTANISEIPRRNNAGFIANTELYLCGHSSLKKLDNQKNTCSYNRIYQKYQSILNFLSPLPTPRSVFFNFVLSFTFDGRVLY